MKTFFRVCNEDTKQGLWYDYNGQHLGLIHDQFSFCANKDLAMPFDEELVGWLSATESLESLWRWFSEDDIRALQNHGWYIYEYEVDSFKFYDKFQHFVICQKTSKVKKKIKL